METQSVVDGVVTVLGIPPVVQAYVQEHPKPEDGRVYLNRKISRRISLSG